MPERDLLADLLADLDDAQRGAVTHPGDPLAIVAPAGSGKTLVLTRRIAWRAARGDLDPERVLAVTFTRKAAGELRSRLGGLGVGRAVTAGTFHSLALSALRRRAADARRRPPVIADRARLVRRIAGNDPAWHDLLVELDWARARGVEPSAYAAAVADTGRRPARAASDVTAAYRAYEEEKRRRGVVDFDDLLAAWADALDDDTHFAAVTHWRFRHVFVDEFQDASSLQFRLLRALTAGGAGLCVVGDPAQAIYGFAGADPTYLADFAAHFPAGEYPDAAVVRLDRNHRSTAPVVAAAHAVLAGGAGPQARCDRPGPAPSITDYETGHDEARGVARLLLEAQGPDRPWRSMAVLARTNAQCGTLAAALQAAGVPHRVRLDDGRDSEVGDDGDVVEVLTFHRAKGLEWSTVVVAGVEDGFVPASSATPAEVAEERRLLAVALGRTGRWLHVTWARTRELGGRIVERAPSPFLDPVRAALTPLPAAPEPVPAEVHRRGLEGARAELAGAQGRAATELMRVLHHWRAAQARAAAVDPEAVLPDRALRRLARERPRSTAALAETAGIGIARAERLAPAVLPLLRGEGNQAG